MRLLVWRRWHQVNPGSRTTRRLRPA